ncbi:hypothetical protein C8J56DRAFT_943668 [Mycena floridula]|nr:hypothetical protein C8J56DRAFT_943668 [Mycena floridula]
MKLIVFSLLVLSVTASTFQPSGIPFKSPVTVAPGLAAQVIFSNLTTPRGIALDNLQNVLVVERGFGVTAFSPVSGGWQRDVVLQDSTLTQGIQVDGNLLYLSSASSAFVYHYDSATKSVVGGPQTIVNSLPPDGELTTHTLQLETDSYGMTVTILIASGPFTNIDPTARDPASGRSQVRRFLVSPVSPLPAVSWLSGELIAYGIRNPAGFAFSPFEPSLYVLENGASIDNVTGLTSTFVNDNPADELNVVSLDDLGGFYGFPDCTTLWNPQADPVGDPQYVSLSTGDQISLHLEADRDDTWCRDPSNNVPPAVSFQAHSVPLDIKFHGSEAFVSFHGSFNRVPPTGYGVVRLAIPLQQDYTFVIQATNLSTCPGSCIRPVGLVFGNSGQMFVTSDSSGELFVVEGL